MPTNPLFYFLGLPVVFLIGVGRGAFGGDLAILGVPLLAFAVDPITATHTPAEPVKALICARLSGFTTFISHGGNPPIAYFIFCRAARRRRLMPAP